jgi:hypothetical protein
LLALCPTIRVATNFIHDRNSRIADGPSTWFAAIQTVENEREAGGWLRRGEERGEGRGS